MKNIISEDIRDVYRVEKLIGRGAYGSVRLSHRIGLPTQKNYAIKTMLRSQCEDDVFALEEELQVMMKLDSPYIVKFYEVYYDKTYIHMVTEYQSKGDVTTTMLS